jgi:hypothetical protein
VGSIKPSSIVVEKKAKFKLPLLSGPEFHPCIEESLQLPSILILEKHPESSHFPERGAGGGKRRRKKRSLPRWRMDCQRQSSGGL